MPNRLFGPLVVSAAALTLPAAAMTMLTMAPAAAA